MLQCLACCNSFGRIQICELLNEIFEYRIDDFGLLAEWFVWDVFVRPSIP